MKKLLALALLTLFVSVFSIGCAPHMMGHAARAALFGAAVVTTAAVVAEHRAHFHHYNCGCPRHWDQGQWVYYYEGGHEYWDPNAGVWYRY